MATKKFNKDWLRDEIVWGYFPAGEESLIKEDRIVDTTRWTIVRELVFMDPFTRKHYRVEYEEGATEMQEVKPFEYEPEEIECQEVEQKIVSIAQWVSV